MTGVVAFTQGRTGYLLADMAYTRSDDGRIAYIDSKFVVASGRTPWAMAATGNLNPHALARKMQEYAPRARNATALLECLPDAIRALQADAIRDDEPPITCGIYGVVWSNKLNRALPFIMFTDPAAIGAALQPFEVVRVDHASTGLGTFDELLGRPVTITAKASFDTRADGMALMDAIRLTATDGTHHVVGGGVQLLTLNRGGARVETLKTYPEDTIGERIEPRG